MRWTWDAHDRRGSGADYVYGMKSFLKVDFRRSKQEFVVNVSACITAAEGCFPFLRLYVARIRMYAVAEARVFRSLFTYSCGGWKILNIILSTYTRTSYRSSTVFPVVSRVSG